MVGGAVAWPPGRSAMVGLARRSGADAGGLLEGRVVDAVLHPPPIALARARAVGDERLERSLRAAERDPELGGRVASRDAPALRHEIEHAIVVVRLRPRVDEQR